MKRFAYPVMALGLSTVLLTGCTDDGDDPGIVDAAPIITLSSMNVPLGQGQRTTVPLSVTDAEGDVTVDIQGPPGLSFDFGEDMTGSALSLYADYAVVGQQELAIVATDSIGQTDEEVQPVEVAPIGWTSPLTWTGEGPEAREHGAMIVDAEGRRAYLLGGSGYNPYLEPLEDAWALNLDDGTWTQLAATGDPLPSGGSRRAAQVGPTTAYLFGGYGENGASNRELLKIEASDAGIAVTTVEQNNPPTPRALHAFVYDPVTGRFVLFGGSGQTPLDDTHVMELSGDTATWTALDLNPRPSPRYGMFYGFDDVTGRLYVFSGAQGYTSLDPARDTWVLDVRADPPVWQLLSEGETTNPPGRRNGTTVFDPTGPRLFVFGGTADAMTTEPGLWVLDLEGGAGQWQQLILAGEPALRSSGFGFHDAMTGTNWLGFGNSSSAVYQDFNALGY